MQEGEGGAQARAVRLSDALPHCAEMLAEISESNERQQPWIKGIQYEGWIKGQREEIATRLESSFPLGSVLHSWCCRHDAWSGQLRKFDKSLQHSTYLKKYLFLFSAEIVTHFAASPSSASLRYLLEDHDDFRSVLQIGANSWNVEALSKACKTLSEYFIQPQDQLWEAILESNSKVKEFYAFETDRKCHWLKYCVQLNMGLHMVKVYQERGFCLNEPNTVSLEASADPASISGAVQLTATHQLFSLVTECIKDGIVTVQFPLLVVRKHQKHVKVFEGADELPVFAPSFRFTDQDDTEIGLADFVEVIYNVLTGNKGSLSNRKQELREKLLGCLIKQQQQQGDETQSSQTSVAGKRKHSETTSTQDSDHKQQQWQVR